MDKREEARLRHLVRKELESRERVRAEEAAELAERGAEMSDERRRIIDEEIRRFHQRRGDTREYENEDGEVEWLTEAEIVEREKQIPVDIEELEVGQRSVRNRVVMISFLLFFGLVLMFVALRERTGTVQVICNVPQATILLNGSPTEFRTDHILRGLPAGYHLVSVRKEGYVADGNPATRVRVGPGDDEIVVLKLKPLNQSTSLEQAQD